MGKGLFERFSKHTQQANDVLGYRLDTLCLHDPHKQLSQTQYTQPALYVVGVLSLLAQYENDEVPPDALAGHSLGEYVALFAAGVFDFETGLELVKMRARLMGEITGGGMAAVTKMDAAALTELVKSDSRFCDIDIANYNAPDQTVVSGSLAQLEQLGAVVRTWQAQFFPLRVSAAFHSRHMLAAQEQFARVAAAATFGPPRIPVIANLSAQPYPTESDEVRHMLVRQIASPVRWQESIEWLQQAGVTRFVEVGPGKVLTRLNAAILEGRPHARPAAAPVQPRASQSPRHPAILMCPGQGGQYFQMGAALYERSAAFRAAFDRCAELGRARLGGSIADFVYKPADASAEFSRTLHTHLANFAFGYSMIEHLRAQETFPCCLVGWSLGEYVALAAAGSLSLQDAVQLVTLQASEIESGTRPAGMLAVVANINVYYSLNTVFHDTVLAGIHTDKSFVVTGQQPSVERAARMLSGRGIPSRMLAVRHGFHSELLDPVAARFKQHCAGLSLRPPAVPVYSSLLRGRLEQPDADYLWRLCRARFNFRDTLTQVMHHHPNLPLIDVGPSGTCAVHATEILGKGVDVRHALRDPSHQRAVQAGRPGAGHLDTPIHLA